MGKTITICEIVGFKITETKLIKSGKPIRSVFHIRTRSDKIVSRAYNNPVEPCNLLARLKNKVTDPDNCPSPEPDTIIPPP